jgi:hypothetical protein
MEPKFILDRDKLSDAEIEKGKDFDALLKKFKAESIEKAKHDQRLKSLKRLRYSAIIAGVVVVCTVSYFQITKKSDENKIAQKTNTQSIKELGVKKFVEPVTRKPLAYSRYKVNSQSGAVIEHPGNSKIKIPVNAFVNKAGERIKGEVEIHYREMRDVADVLASGVPMQYDSAGYTYDFESRGMMDIKGYQNGEPVFIQIGKQLEVEMIAAKKEGSFCNYYLDTLKKSWIYIGSTPEMKIQELAEVKPSEKNRNVLKEKIEKAERELKQELVQNKNSIPVPEKPRKANPARKRFTLDVDYKEFPELIAYKNASFEIGEENKNYTAEMSKIEWMDAKISEGPMKGKNYLLTLVYGKREEKLIVYPVLEGKELDAANKEYELRFANYQKELKSREEADVRRRQLREAEIAALKKAYSEGKTGNSSLPVNNADHTIAQFFYVNNFGVYNSDCKRRKPHEAMVNAEFKLGEKKLIPERVFLVELGPNRIFTFNREEWQEFKYNPKMKNVLIVPVNDKVYICNSNDFSQAKTNEKRKVFQFTECTAEVATTEELRKILELES